MRKYFSKASLAWLCFAALLACIPIFIKNIHWLNILVFSNIFVLFVISWDFSSGHTGYLSLGHTFFIGLGGYTSAILTYHLGFPLYLSIVMSSIITMIIGISLTIPAFKRRGPYFLMLSFALPLLMMKIVRIGFFSPITGGHMGLSPLPTLGSPPEKYKVYYFTLIIVLVVGYALWRVSRSSIGDVLRAIHSDEELLENLGIDTFKYKLFSFMVCGLIGGLGGALWVHHMGSVSPHSVLDLYLMIEIVIAAMIGGEGSIVGPMLGGYFCIILLELTRLFAMGSGRLLIFILIGIILISIKPTGLFLPILGYVGKLIAEVPKKLKIKKAVNRNA